MATSRNVGCFLRLAPIFSYFSESFQFFLLFCSRGGQFHGPTTSVAPSPTHNSLIRSGEGLTLETSAFNFFMVANLP